MLGVLFPASVPNPSVYRHHFLASSAIGDCEERTKSLVLLFRRIVGMITRFTNTPPLPKPLPNFRTADNQIRITPSKLADVPLSDKAIPYYYLQDGTPPLFQLWNADKTQRVRANQNLGYRSDEYLPTAPVFVTEALRFDLEPYNFLRIEGHLGKNYQGVMQRLLTLKSQYRLPIELIVLRTGVFDETIAVDLSKEECRFQDLETLYDTLKTELTCFLCKEVQYFYSLPYEGRSTITESVKPKLPLLVQCAPDFLVKSKTLGRFFEDWLSSLPAEVIPDIDPNIIINFLNTQNAGQSIIIIFYLIIYIEKLFEQLSQNLGQLNFVNFERRYRDLVSVTEAIERDREETIGNIEGNANLLSWDELDDRLEVIIYSCHLDAFRVLQEEFKRRIKATKQKQFLSSFLKEHPGIQHKAGVPLGGTFIIVYHDDPDIIKSGRTFSAEIGLTNSLANQNTFSVESAKILSGALTRLQSSNKDCVFDPDIQLIFAELTGQIPTIEFFPIQGELATNAEKIIAETVNGFVDGAVIADFFLPYICCSDCSPVQFVLPKMPPSFNVLMGCPNVRGITLVTIIPEGGLPPYSIKVDKLEYKLLRGSLQLDVGSHTLQIRDAEGKESISQTIIVASALQISEPVFQCSEDLKTYTATFNITGGTVPYMVNGTSIKGNKYTTDSIASGTGAVIEVVDSNKCSQKREFNNSCVKPCDLPCAGIALKRGYYFNLPNTDAPRATVSVKFSFEFPQGNTIDLSTEVKAILEKVGTDKDSFAKQINLLIAEKTRSTDWLKFESILKTSEQDVLDEWQIEYFECLDFNLNIQVTSFTLSVEVPLQSVLTETVTPKTSTIVFKQGEQTLIDIKIPAFDPVKIDKCNPQIPVQKLCDNRPNLTLIISNEVDGLTAKLTANHTGNDQPIAYLWDVPGANPPLSNNPIASFTFTQIEPGTKPIRLTAFTKEGCRVILEDTITLG